MQIVSRSYKDLLVRQKGIALVKQIHAVTRQFPAEEKSGIVAQVRRAAVSVVSNIAEGPARGSTGGFVQFISHPEASIAELRAQTILGVDLGFCSEVGAEANFELIEYLRKMLNGLRRKPESRL